MLRRVRLLWSPIDELTITGSCWSRFLAKAVPTNSLTSPPAAAATTTAALPTPFITLIPTLHVASVEFYDKVLDYMVKAVRERENVVILLEGICDTEDSELQQMEEYFAIARRSDLKQAMLQKADQNTLYDSETIRTICEELAVDYDVLMQQKERIRLQECYLRPKMAALVGLHLRNDADLNLREVEAIVAEENDTSRDSFIPISRLGYHPLVRQSRERKVVRTAQLRCMEWLQQKCGGEVILPWGFCHAKAIRHDILELNARDEGVVFLESDDKLCRVPFGITKELLT